MSGLKQTYDAAALALASLSPSERMAALAMLLGAAACEGLDEYNEANRDSNRDWAHRRLGQAIGKTYAVVDKHFAIEGQS